MCTSLAKKVEVIVLPSTPPNLTTSFSTPRTADLSVSVCPFVSSQSSDRERTTTALAHATSSFDLAFLPDLSLTPPSLFLRSSLVTGIQTSNRSRLSESGFSCKRGTRTPGAHLQDLPNSSRVWAHFYERFKKWLRSRARPPGPFMNYASSLNAEETPRGGHQRASRVEAALYIVRPIVLCA